MPADVITGTIPAHRRPAPRYEALARVLLDSPDPIIAIASLIGDHEGRLDGLAERLRKVEGRLAYQTEDAR